MQGPGHFPPGIHPPRPASHLPQAGTTLGEYPRGFSSQDRGCFRLPGAGDMLQSLEGVVSSPPARSQDSRVLPCSHRPRSPIVTPETYREGPGRGDLLP